MQPPPPTGCTGRAPLGVGGAGVTLDEAAVVVAAMASPGDQPTAKTRAATQEPSAAVVLAFARVTTNNCSFSAPDAQNRAPASEKSPRRHRGSTKDDRGVARPGRDLK